MPPTEPAAYDVPAMPRSAANPPLPGPGLAPGNIERTGEQTDPGSIGGGTLERPERYLLVVRQVASPGEPAGAPDGAAARYLFARWPDWPYPALLSLSAPSPEEGLEAAVRAVLRAHMGVVVASPPRPASVSVPARIRHPRTGVEGLGWLRAIAVDVAGEPTPDALLEDVVVLTASEAVDALPTDVERIVFAAGIEA